MHIYTKIFKTIKAVDVYAYKCQKLKSKKKSVKISNFIPLSF